VKVSLSKEIDNIQNTALSAYLLALFSNSYYKEAQEFPNLQLLFVVYPLIYIKDIAELIDGTRKTTGLLGCVSKLKDGSKKKNDILLCLQSMIQESKLEIMTALRMAFLSNMLSIGNDGKIIPIEKNIKQIKIKGHDVSQMCKEVEKLGIWFAKLSLIEIEQILKVRF